jgi:hypothetical protein
MLFSQIMVLSVGQDRKRSPRLHRHVWARVDLGVITGRLLLHCPFNEMALEDRLGHTGSFARTPPLPPLLTHTCARTHGVRLKTVDACTHAPRVPARRPSIWAWTSSSGGTKARCGPVPTCTGGGGTWGGGGQRQAAGALGAFGVLLGQQPAPEITGVGRVLFHFRTERWHKREVRAGWPATRGGEHWAGC